MNRERISNISYTLVNILSFTALVAALSGFGQAAQQDEGAGAHIFQIAVVLLAPMLLVFLLTTDRSDVTRVAKRLTLPGIAVLAAFAAVYVLEHHR